MTTNEQLTLNHLRAAVMQMVLALETEKDNGRAMWIEQQITCTNATIWQYGESD